MSEVGIAELRRTLKDWVDRARRGDEVTITDRGEPVAKLTGYGTASLMSQLVAEGRVSRPSTSPRPVARSEIRVRSRGSVADLIIEERDTAR